MSHLRIDRGDGTTQIIEMWPVEKYEADLRHWIKQREFFKHPERIDALKAMDRDQLMHLSSILTCMVEEYAYLYDGSFTPEHHKLVRQFIEMRKMAGPELWPELGDMKAWEEVLQIKKGDRNG